MQQPSFLALHKLGDLFLALFNLSLTCLLTVKTCVWLLEADLRSDDQKISEKITHTVPDCGCWGLWGGKTPGDLMGKQFIYRC